jgi:DNA polymerase III epsilon subunit-like protein
MTSTLIVLDFETTGMSPRLGARPTKIAAELCQNLSLRIGNTRLCHPDPFCDG